ncbi:MAG: hypothetical protein FRX49_11220 [Trebouxia sp. A1-2]|nr:MAG: hypothetical protein FRX49_11220 [Trebouxia sp. A1-2]
MDTRMASTRLINKLKELQDVLAQLQGEKCAADVRTRKAQQDKEEAEHAVETTQCQLETCKASFQRETAALQMQVQTLEQQQFDQQAQIKQQASELAAILEQRSQAYQNLKSCHHQVQQEVQAKQAEYMTLQRQLEGQADLMTAVEEEVKAARQEFAGIQNAVACNQAHVADHQSWVRKIVVTESKLLGQLDAQGKAIVEVQQQNAELKKEIASHQEELQIASAKLICREEKIASLSHSMKMAQNDVQKATEQHSALMDQLQASNDLVYRLGGTCRAQLQALDQLRQDMASSQALHHERHDEQKEALHNMRQTESKLLQQVQALHKRCAELETPASQAKISGSVTQYAHTATQTMREKHVVSAGGSRPATPAPPASAVLCQQAPVQREPPFSAQGRSSAGTNADGLGGFKPLAGANDAVATSSMTAKPEPGTNARPCGKSATATADAKQLLLAEPQPGSSEQANSAATSTAVQLHTAAAQSQHAKPPPSSATSGAVKRGAEPAECQRIACALLVTGGHTSTADSNVPSATTPQDVHLSGPSPPQGVDDMSELELDVDTHTSMPVCTAATDDPAVTASRSRLSAVKRPSCEDVLALVLSPDAPAKKQKITSEHAAGRSGAGVLSTSLSAAAGHAMPRITDLAQLPAAGAAAAASSPAAVSDSVSAAACTHVLQVSRSALQASHLPDTACVSGELHGSITKLSLPPASNLIAAHTLPLPISLSTERGLHAGCKLPIQSQHSKRSPVTLFSSSVITLKHGSVSSKAAKTGPGDIVMPGQCTGPVFAAYKLVIEELSPDSDQHVGLGSEEPGPAKLAQQPAHVAGNDRVAPEQCAVVAKPERGEQQLTEGQAYQMQSSYQPAAQLVFDDHTSGENGRHSSRTSGNDGHTKLAQLQHRPTADTSAGFAKHAVASDLGAIFSSLTAFEDMSDGEEEADDEPSAGVLVNTDTPYATMLSLRNAAGWLFAIPVASLGAKRWTQSQALKPICAQLDEYFAVFAK